MPYHRDRRQDERRDQDQGQGGLHRGSPEKRNAPPAGAGGAIVVTDRAGGLALQIFAGVGVRAVADRGDGG
jgi:hypothetical protein